MIEYILLAVFTVALNLLCYQLGRSKAKREQDEKTIQSYETAKKIRDTLNDPSVVDKLLRKYKR